MKLYYCLCILLFSFSLEHIFIDTAKTQPTFGEDTHSSFTKTQTEYENSENNKILFNEDQWTKNNTDMLDRNKKQGLIAPILYDNSDANNSVLPFVVNEALYREELQQYISPIDSYTDILVEKEKEKSLSEQYESAPVIKTDITSPPKLKVYRSTTALPLFYQKMGLNDDTAPLPFTVMIFGNYMQSTVLTSNFKGTSVVDDVSIDLGLLGKLPIGDFNMPLTGFADVKQVEQRFSTGGVRFAMNVLPFWSVYGILGFSTGYTKSAVNVKNIYMKDVDIKINTGRPIFDAAANAAIKAMGNTLLVKEGSMPFVMAFDAFSTGIGTSLSIGGKLFFTSVDANYVITAVESANIIVHTVNASARFGLHKSFGSQQMAVWVGANYMENIAGSDKLGAIMSVERLSDLFQLESLAQNMVGDKPANIRWAVDQKPLNVFSAIVGMKYSPRKNFDIVTEVGFIDKLNVMVSAAYNF